MKHPTTSTKIIQLLHEIIMSSY